MSRSLSDRLSEHVAGLRYEDLPPAAIDGAKRSLLDAVGVTLGASGLGEGCGAFADLAKAAGGPAECTLIGHGVRAPLLSAVLANGAAAHALDFEDAFDAAPAHPNAPLTPVALALAEQRGGVSGKALITAMAAGCDLVCRLSLGLRDEPARHGWYTPPILGAFGAAAAAAKLLRLDALQTRDAFSLTLCQATCSAEIKYSARSVVRAVRDGFAAQAGLLSAMLAERGVAGFETPFEGRAGLFALYAHGVVDLDAITGGLGEQFFGAELSYKPWPSCRGTHAFIEAALKLREQEGFAVEDIVAVETLGGPIQRMLAEPRAQKLAPQTAIDAKFSIPFTVATALVFGEVGLRHFDFEALSNAQVLSLASRVVFAVDPDADATDAAGGTMRLRLRDGRCLSLGVAHPRGHPSNPMPWSELETKFETCAALARRPPSPAAVGRFLEQVHGLDEIADARLLFEQM